MTAFTGPSKDRARNGTAAPTLPKDSAIAAVAIRLATRSGPRTPTVISQGAKPKAGSAYAIDENSPAPIPWDTESLAFYLRNGWHELHGVSRGPMAEVTGNLGLLPDEDVRAIAIYVASLMGEPSAGAAQRSREAPR